MNADIPTVTAPPRAMAMIEPGTSSSGSIDDARFAPGTVLIERYRIVGLLGKGGMGEVYRAEDLKLRQPVALKFLPKALTSDPKRLERFHHEVRVARQVSHPNVCRVYDIGEADGQPFISMEYVDGEDLALLLRRIGRPSKDKAVQIARQLCAGLAAAHDKGVLHRDLKPHNVMLDGQGRVRVTDFGLAGFADEFSGREIRVGTPAYMAPEQLAGESVSVQSDIYSLGLVLYELFSGQRAFDAAGQGDKGHSRRTPPTSLTSIVEDVDPIVERVILRCLEVEPGLRPSSALAVAAALPGGDPLAAALAAGETPSPEVVAAADERGVLPVRVAVALLIVTLVGMLGALLVSESTRVVERVPMPETPQVLAKQARDIAASFGYADPIKDTAMGFAYAVDFLDRIRREDAAGRDAEPAHSEGRSVPISFWYRQSSSPLLTMRGHFFFLDEAAKVSFLDPPPKSPGMINVRLDTHGRLIEFLAVPFADLANDDSDATDPDWADLFDAADLDRSRMTPCTPLSVPPVYCGQRRAWCSDSDSDLRLEVGTIRGRIVTARVVIPEDVGWMVGVTGKVRTGIGGTINAALFVTMILGSLILAVRNLQQGRSDKKTAMRLAVFLFCVLLAAWVAVADHAPDFAAEVFKLGQFAVGKALFWAGLCWMNYIALEPFVRRGWPERLISWTRLFSGAWRDPLVGRDVLIGLAILAVATPLLGTLKILTRDAMGLPWLQGIMPANPGSLDPLLGAGYVAGALLQAMAMSILLAFVYLVIPSIFRIALGSFWLAMGLFALCWSTILCLGFGDGTALSAAFTGVWVILFLAVVHRVGLLAGVTSFFFAFSYSFLPITSDPAKWYAGLSWVWLVLVAGLATIAFWTCLAGRPLLKDELLHPKTT